MTEINAASGLSPINSFMNEIACGDDICQKLLSERDQAIKLAQRIMSDLEQLNNLTKSSSPYEVDANLSLAEPLIKSLRSHGHAKNFKSQLKDSVKGIDRLYWEKIMESSQLTVLMSTKDKKQLQNTIKTDAPPFDAPTVIGTLNEQNDRRMEVFVKSSVELFSELSDDFKSNDKIRLGKKVILPHAFCGENWNNHSYSNFHLCDIERIFLVLDLKNPSLIKFEDSLASILWRLRRAGQTSYESDYFFIKMHKNGSIHVSFKREDLVQRFNDLIANVHNGASLGRRTSKAN